MLPDEVRQHIGELILFHVTDDNVGSKMIWPLPRKVLDEGPCDKVGDRRGLQVVKLCPALPCPRHESLHGVVERREISTEVLPNTLILPDSQLQDSRQLQEENRWKSDRLGLGRKDPCRFEGGRCQVRLNHQT